MRPSRLPTATVSICVTPEEAELIRDATHVAGMTVSAWATSRAAVALSSPPARRAVGKYAEKLAAAPPARGARRARISMVMRVPDHDALKATAAAHKMTAHAFAQAALLMAAEDELRDLPAPVRRAAEDQRRAIKLAGTMQVTVPAWVAELDDLSAMVRDLVLGTIEAILDGKGRAIAAGVQKLVAANADGPQVTLHLHLPEADVRSIALVLGVPPGIVATAYTIRAAKAAQRLVVAA